MKLSYFLLMVTGILFLGSSVSFSMKEELEKEQKNLVVFQEKKQTFDVEECVKKFLPKDTNTLIVHQTAAFCRECWGRRSRLVRFQETDMYWEESPHCFEQHENLLLTCAQHEGPNLLRVLELRPDPTEEASILDTVCLLLTRKAHITVFTSDEAKAKTFKSRVETELAQILGNGRPLDSLENRLSCCEKNFLKYCPSPSQKFDVVNASNVLSNLSPRESRCFIENARRFLKNEGILCVDCLMPKDKSIIDFMNKGKEEDPFPGFIFMEYSTDNQGEKLFSIGPRSATEEEKARYSVRVHCARTGIFKETSGLMSLFKSEDVQWEQWETAIVSSTVKIAKNYHTPKTLKNLWGEKFSIESQRILEAQCGTRDEPMLCMMLKKYSKEAKKEREKQNPYGFVPLLLLQYPIEPSN